jgi:hypothetical protein
MTTSKLPTKSWHYWTLSSDKITSLFKAKYTSQIRAWPISGTMAEVFLQQLEKSILKHLIDAKILSFYTRYVDDIFPIYNSTRPTQTTYCNTLTLSTGAFNLALPWNPTTMSTSQTCQ